MAYDRFCDIHVTSEVKYHFTSEILDYCNYQLENKKLNLLGKRALIVLDFISDWELTAAALLDSFRKATVILSGGAGFVAGKIVSVVGSLKPDEKVFLKVGGSVAKILTVKQKDRLAPELTADFKGIVVSDVEGGFSLARHVGRAEADATGQTIIFSGTRNLGPLDDKISYVAITVPMSEISKALEASSTRDLISWLSGAPSKLRFTCHGDGEGNLQMGNQTGGNDLLPADCLATWLHANGLHQAGQLRTIALNMCLAARHDLTPAVIKNGVYSPAEGSAVAVLASKLGSYGVHGIVVTGSNEVVDAKPTPGTTRTRVTGDLASHGQAFRKISIPRGFEFETATMTMTVPDGWTIADRMLHESKLCVLKPPGTWTVKKLSGDFLFEGTEDGKEKSYAFGNDGWIVSAANKEALSAEGWVRLDAHRMKFAGTGGSCSLESTADKKLTIIERLAKSKAKAVATS